MTFYRRSDLRGAMKPTAGRFMRGTRLEAGSFHLRFAAALLLSAVSLPAQVSGQAAALSPLGSNQSTLSGCDDCNAPVSITDVFPQGINFGGTIYNQLYISTNGYVTFGHGNSSYSPLGITAYTRGPIVATQYDDLDPRKGGDIYYDQNAAEGFVVITYQNVLPYTSAVDGSGTNSYQVVLRTSAGDPQDFQIELRYQALNWARSGNNSAWPTAGWSAGNQAAYSELPQSGESNFRDVLGGSNVSEAGVYRWQVEGGVVQSVPTVDQTTSISSITGSSAASGGHILFDGGLTVTIRGLAYGTSTGPTISSDTAVSASGSATFSATLTGLIAGTTYYVRAFATNSLGTGYGPERSFTTLSVVPPSVATGAVSSLTPSSATSGGNVTSDGGGSVTARGVAYGTDPNPTVSGTTAAAGTGTGEFSAEITGLDPATTYHVRAYAINSAGTSYGDDVDFTTPKLDQAITFDALQDRTYGDALVVLVASASSALPVSFGVDDASPGSVSGDTIYILGSGTITVTASQVGDATHNPAPSVERSFTVDKKTIRGVFKVPVWKAYDGTDAADVTERGLEGVVAGDEGWVSLAGGTAHYEDASLGQDKWVELQGAKLDGSRAPNYRLGDVRRTRADIVAGPPHHMTIEGPNEIGAGAPGGQFTITVRDAFGNPTAVTAESELSLATDHAAPTASFSPSATLTLGVGVVETHFTYMNGAAEDAAHQVSATLLSGMNLPGGTVATRDVVVSPGSPGTFRLEAAAGGEIGEQVTGSPFSIRISALDGEGNVAEDFSGTVILTSDGLLGSGNATANFQEGILASHQVTVMETGVFTLTATDADGAVTGTSSPFTVLAPGTHVGVQVGVNDPRPSPHDTVTIEVTVTNWGAAPAEEVSVRSPLLGQDRLVAIGVDVDRGTVASETGVWQVGRMEAGESVKMRITAVVIIPGQPQPSDSGEEL